MRFKVEKAKKATSKIQWLTTTFLVGAGGGRVTFLKIDFRMHCLLLGIGFCFWFYINLCTQTCSAISQKGRSSRTHTIAQRSISTNMFTIYTMYLCNRYGADPVMWMMHPSLTTYHSKLGTAFYHDIHNKSSQAILTACEKVSQSWLSQRQPG